MVTFTLNERHAATLEWCYDYTIVRRHGMKAQNLKRHGELWFKSGELQTMLRDIFDQCDYLLDKDENGKVTADEDEIDELWQYTLDHWDYKGHMELVERLLEIGWGSPELLGAGKHVTDITGVEGDPSKVGGSILRMLKVVADSEARQTDLGVLVEEIEREEAEHNESAGAW
jgi:hypothetical protein